jgi:predicted  nucleic acid-binding Zn-ribbon protein
MHSGAVTASRELTAMVDQIKSLEHRRSDLEDAELELMVAAEPLDAELAVLTPQRESLDSEGTRLRALVAEAESEIHARLSQSAEARIAAAADVPEGLLKTYDALRARLGGVGVARLVGSSCGGCHLVLPAVEVDRVRRQPPDAVVTCEQCGRILVH